jgi:hypothetical protein
MVCFQVLTAATVDLKDNFNSCERNMREANESRDTKIKNKELKIIKTMLEIRIVFYRFFYLNSKVTRKTNVVIHIQRKTPWERKCTQKTYFYCYPLSLK